MSGFAYQPNLPALLSLVFLASGSLFLMLAYRAHQKRQRLREQGFHAIGTVLRLEEGSSDESPYPLYPVIEFVTAQQQTIVRRHSYGQYPPQYSVGQQIDVFYDPADPRSYVLGTHQRGPEFWVLLILGLVFALVGLGLVLIVASRQ